MSEHWHTTLVEGCFRCELNRDEMGVDTRCTSTSAKHRCSRERGHDGPHIADLGNLVCGWPNREES